MRHRLLRIIWLTDLFIYLTINFGRYCNASARYSLGVDLQARRHQAAIAHSGDVSRQSNPPRRPSTEDLLPVRLIPIPPLSESYSTHAIIRRYVEFLAGLNGSSSMEPFTL